MSEYPIAKDSYVAFDGLSIKEKIKQNLNKSNLFANQNFEGSNLIQSMIHLEWCFHFYYII